MLSTVSQSYNTFYRSASISGVPRNFVRGGSTNSAEDRENRDLGAVAPLVRGSGDSCNLVFRGGFEPPKPPPRYATGVYCCVIANIIHITFLHFLEQFKRHKWTSTGFIYTQNETRIIILTWVDDSGSYQTGTKIISQVIQSGVHFVQTLRLPGRTD
jgi:hypothetical protein